MTKFRGLQRAILFAATIGVGVGCELITAPDRNKISDTSSGTTGGGGTGGTATTGGTGGTTTTGGTGGTTTGGGGTGGMTTTGGTGGTGGMTTTGGTGGTGGMMCVPVSDDNECTDDVCNPDGTTAHNPTRSGSACSNGGTLCDGNGLCVECLGPSDCPGQDDTCQTRACAAGKCGFDFAPADTPLPSQKAGDCKQSVCDGSGKTVDQNDDNDLPDDKNACTDDVCTTGVASNPPKAQGTGCGVSGTGDPLLCDDKGQCVGCNVASDCPGADSECQQRTCTAGVCGVDFTAADTPVAAQTAHDCLQQVCDGNGNVTASPDDMDLPADDGNACTDETCAGGTPSHPDKSNGTSCNDGDSCSQTDTCQSGTCTGGNPVVCVPLNQCRSAGTCNPATGVCSTPSKADGTGCDDGNACSQVDTCQAGACMGGSPVTCSAQDQCHVAGACNPADGTCSNPAKADGAACNDGDGCTQSDTCLAGACTGGMPVSCAAQDQCHDAGVCNPADGMCSNPVKADGALCNDGNACTQTDACLAGSCLGASPVMCSASDQCHVAGTCNPANGTCDDPNAPDGTACSLGGNSGACVGGACGTCGDGVPDPGEQCDDGNGVNGDGCDNNCKTSGCGNGAVAPGEQCDDGNLVNGDGCDANCTTTACGNGIVTATELCDDANTADNDGCSADCKTVEVPYSCTGSPSVCTSPVEINCGDGKDNDGDGQIDCADSDCALGCNANVGPCAAGQALLVYTATDTPKNIPDNNVTGVNSIITVGSAGAVKRVVVQLSATHTYDSDLSFTLTSPSGSSNDASSNNGGSGVNYTSTIFNDACATNITAGVAPFNGCFKPEAAFTPHADGPSKGAWILNSSDNANLDTGTLTSYRLALCVAPTTCGNGTVNAGEGCDDGNTLNGDGCSGACAVESGYGCSGAPSVCSATCGDGIKAGAETCDDANAIAGDGCSSACAIEAGFACINVSPSACTPICGNGSTNGSETCDDSNTASGDGCDSSCASEADFTEVEPNGTLADADTNAGNGLVLQNSAVVSGAVTPTLDKDIYKMVLAADGVVRFETFDASGKDCTSANVPAAMKLSLLGSAGAVLYTDTTRGIGNCSALTANLTAGTYYVQVEKNTSGTIAAYKLQVKVQTSKGNETEVNDAKAQANPLAGSDVYVFGGHQVAADKDWFAITVPAGKSLRAEIIEGSGAETCESQGIDSKVFLVNSAGSELGNADDVGRGYCSLMDGTGATPVNSFAHNLAAGTYYLRVEASDLCSGAGCQFDYRLVVTLR